MTSDEELAARLKPPDGEASRTTQPQINGTNENAAQNAAVGENGAMETNAPKSVKEEMKQIAFVNVKGLPGLAWSREAVLIKMIADENPPEMHPYAAFFVRKGILKLIFETEQKRDNAVLQKLTMGNMRVEVEKPYSESGYAPTNRKLIYLFGIPVFEKSENVAEWLKSLGLEIKGEVRTTKYRETNILTGRRSVLVSYPRGFEIPGYAHYEPAKGLDDSDKGPTVSFWWPRMPKCCRQCWKFGHFSRECAETKLAAETEGDLASGPMDQGDEPFQDAQDSTSAATHVPAPGQTTNVVDLTQFPELPTSSSHAPALSKNVLHTMPAPTLDPAKVPHMSLPDINADQQLDNDYGQSGRFTFFHKSNSPLAITCKAPFRIGNQDYINVSQYVNARKAEECGNFNVKYEIMMEKNTSRIKQLGEGITWTKSKDELKAKVFDWLWTACAAMFANNPENLKALLATRSTRIVYCSEADTILGCGVRDTEATDRTQWRGRNLYGDLLTHMRKFCMYNESRKRSLVESSGMSPPTQQQKNL